MSDAAKQAAAAQIYQFLITLQHIDPPIWRRFQVRDDTTLGALHDVVQFVMGWDDDHLHEFNYGGISYSAAEIELENVEDEEEVTLRALGLKVKSAITYTYDFGDSWEHKLKVEKILPPAPATKYPLCIDGERACPPEDCGGVWGYEDIQRILTLPAKQLNEDELDILEWMGDDFDPEAFDVTEVNKRLARL